MRKLHENYAMLWNSPGRYTITMDDIRFCVYAQWSLLTNTTESIRTYIGVFIYAVFVRAMWLTLAHSSFIKKTWFCLCSLFGLVFSMCELNQLARNRTTFKCLYFKTHQVEFINIVKWNFLYSIQFAQYSY